jgi:hypothetical protein
MLLASVRIQQKLKLPLHHSYFAVVNKVGRGFSKHNWAAPTRCPTRAGGF